MTSDENLQEPRPTDDDLRGQQPPTATPNATLPSTIGRFFQVGLSTLLLLTACIAVWWYDWSNRREIAQLESRLITMRPLVRELVVKDHEHIAVIQKQPTTYDEAVWHIYIPNDSLSLCSATRGLAMPNGDEVKRVPPAAKAPLAAGRHMLELRVDSEKEDSVVRVLVDDEVVIETREPSSWKEGSGSRGGAHFSSQTDHLPGSPLVLFSRVYSEKWVHVGPRAPSRGNGVRLWIE